MVTGAQLLVKFEQHETGKRNRPLVSSSVLHQQPVKTHFVFIVWTKRHKRFASVWQVENCYASRSVSLKTGASAVMLGASVGATGLGGLKTFQGLEGQRRGSSGTTSTTGEADGLAAAVSSSEDSSLAAEPGCSTFLSGVQPGGRRLLRG